MSIINYAVYHQAKKRTILPWKITSVSPPSTTFGSFFLSEVRPLLCQEAQCLLSEIYVGKGKDILDSVSSELVIAEVVPLFGPFVKFAVGEMEEVG
jgi:hypothetical protein